MKKPTLILQNCEAELAGTIFDYFEDSGRDYLLVCTYRNDDFPDCDEVEAIITLGCPESIIDYYQFEYLKRLYHFFSQAVRVGKPNLGICFGGQLLAKVLGARVERNAVKEIGNYRVRLTEAGKKDALFKDFPESFPVMHWHADTFRIPHGLELLAEGDDCRNQAFRKEKMVAVQFHLEATADELDKWCDVYRDELEEVGKNKEQLVAQYRKNAETIKKLNYLLLDNFLSLQ